jgi:hypothetical protein
MSVSNPSPIVTEVVRFEDLPPGSRGTRRAIARWSHGTESEALTWYADEILICEGDLIGKTREQLRSVHFRRDWTGSSPSAYGAAGQLQRGPTALAPSPKRTSTPLRRSRLPLVPSERSTFGLGEVRFDGGEGALVTLGA